MVLLIISFEVQSYTRKYFKRESPLGIRSGDSVGREKLTLV